uniref:Uncharacterized protein n=1 Tax=Rhizophora mucronata TaxID=61149 RepID=A0A2P2QAB1_RHIMU
MHEYPGKNVLTVSRSTAFLSRTKGNRTRSDEKKKGRLFSKFLRPRRERT